MIDPAWLAVPLGVVVLVLIQVDVFLSVLHVEAESPVSNTFNRVLWRTLRAASWPLVKARSARGVILSYGAPLMIVGIIGFWAIGYILGFALLFFPMVQNPHFFKVPDGSTAAPLNDALYFSAVSFFTIGYGDISAVHPVARLLAVLEGAAGLLTTSLAVAYLIAVYPFITRAIALATSLNQETGGRADGVVIAARYVVTGRFDALGDRLRAVNDEPLHLAQAHGIYPVLYYVRPINVHESFVRVLALVQGIIGTLRYGLDREAYREITADPRLAVLEEGLLYTLHSLSASMHLQLAPDSPSDVEAHAQDFRTLRMLLRKRGLTISSDDDDRACRMYAQFRAATDPYIVAYARNVRYKPEAVWATFGRWARGSALIEPVADDTALHAQHDPGKATALPTDVEHPTAELRVARAGGTDV